MFEESFPRLRRGQYRLTSPATREYNCIAWAAGQTDRWWEPDPFEIYYWPPGVPRQRNAASLIAAFALSGYTQCASASYEKGLEKIAIYTDSQGLPTHAARQLSDGKWTSKLGECEDIEHEELVSLGGSLYGEPTIFLSRPASRPA